MTLDFMQISAMQNNHKKYQKFRYNLVLSAQKISGTKVNLKHYTTVVHSSVENVLRIISLIN